MPHLTRFSITDVDQFVVELHKVRSVDLAHDHEESQLGLASVAVPILVRNHAVGALAISHAATVQLGPRVEQALRDTAAKIARTCRDALQRGNSHYFPYEG
jgi:DNA-binding IclR family transcriptional regulator